jgi:2,3-bisphosphoglycerate-dependent phosphoglycerate mutase
VDINFIGRVRLAYDLAGAPRCGMPILILVRHGESEWNERNLFTGWYDCDLTDKGRREAAKAGPLIAADGRLPDVVHTSLQRRAINTANLLLDTIDRQWIPVRRSWRLNERHYGDLTGLDKRLAGEKFGAEQVQIWRRSYDVPPPPITKANQYNPNKSPQYQHLPPDLIPRTECLKDVVARLLPYWYDDIAPDLIDGKVVLVAAHGNSLRALVKHLDGIGDGEIAGLDIPTGVPLVYDLNAALRPKKKLSPLERGLGDLDAIKAAAAAVANQSKA